MAVTVAGRMIRAFGTRAIRNMKNELANNICGCTQKPCDKTRDGGVTCEHEGRVYFVKGFNGCPWEKEKK